MPSPHDTQTISDAEKYNLGDHQGKALNKLSNGKILWGGVGSGKSRTGAAYYDKFEAPKRVYVITTAKKRDSFDWQREFYDIGIGPATGPNYPKPNTKRRTTGSSEVRATRSGPLSGPETIPSRRSKKGGVGTGGYRDSEGIAGIYPWVLTVDSWNNISKYADVSGAFFIFDEQRLVGSGDWTRKFLRIAKRNHWILLSATPGDTWMDYIPVFVANNFYKNRTEFKREHVVYNTFTKFPKVDRYINVGRLMRQRAELLVEMPVKRHTTRHVVEVPLKYDKEALEMVLKKRWHIYENRPLRDIAEMFLVGRKLVNSHPSRLEMVKELWQNHPKLIVFYNYNYELELLRSLANPSTDSIQKTSNYLNQAIGSKTRTGLSGNSESIHESIPVLGGIKSIPSSTHPKEDTWGSCKCSPSVEKSGTKTTGTLYLPKTATSLGGDLTNQSLKCESDRVALTAESLGVRTTSSKIDLELVGRAESVVRDKWTSTTSSKNGLENSISTLSSGNVRGSAESLTDQTNHCLTMSCNTCTNKSTLDGSTRSKDGSSSQSVEIAEWNGHKHQPVPPSNRWLYLVQYTAGAEGWNCIDTDAMIMYSRNYSWKVYEQAQGRIDRLNTPFKDLWYYDFMTDSFIDKAIGRSLRAKETFNEAKYARLFEG